MINRVVNMDHEMYNDGLYFTEQATKETHFGDIQRCYRFAVVSFASSFESFLNRKIKRILVDDINKVDNGEYLLGFLNQGFEFSKLPNELRTIDSKLELMEKLLGLNNGELKTTEFMTFNKDIIKLRNAIVHYSHSNFSTLYEKELGAAASTGAKLLVSTISSFCDISCLEFPPFYNKEKYEPIK
ncbi:hypothetical protein BTO30_12500 [Domibacillus antri]|uniref:RiboL-PSP-HEPN domain-containing protein n=1 Tax=Domibacillus antri TaxID=1714264 RepID=A0A1Q8Q3N5_9BACI|nr:hypothetical protein [Domibacillus antri]OLN21912.1 hypothetical protein BTO30_12500 [Domibacillus antri]